MITTIRRTLINTFEDAKNISFSQKLKDDIHRLLYDQKVHAKELANLEKQIQHLDKQKFQFNKLDKLLTTKQSDVVTQSLLNEIRRLRKIIDNQVEIITHDKFITSQTSQLIEPDMVKSQTPLGLVKSFFRFRKELDTYEKQILNSNLLDTSFILEKDKNGLQLYKTRDSAYKSEYLEETSKYIELGNKLKRYYYLADIPSFLSPYVFFRLLTSDVPFTISIFLEPSSSSDLLKKAKQRLSVLEMQQSERMKHGKIRDQQIERNIEEAASFIDELVHEVEKGIIYSLYLELEADNEEELTRLHKKLQTLTESMELTLNQYTFGHKKALKNFMPFGIDNVKENRILQSTAASYLIPFVSKQLNDPNGIFMGVNAYNDSLVLVDPFTSRNNNINIFGVSGSGKSVTSKVLMSRLFMRGVQIIVIDPEGEYVDLAKELGGEVISFTRENGINPFYLNSSNEGDILDHISTLKTFFKFFIPPHHFDGAILDEAIIKLYNKGQLNFENLLELLNDHPMKKDLSVLSTGSMRGIFDSIRKLELDNQMIVLDLHDLKKDEKRDPAMYLLTSLIWNLINKQGDQKRMLFIDEAHKLLVDQEVAIFYRELVKQARKRNTGIVSITQDVEDFLNSNYGKAIITNSETKILLKQSYASLSQIATIYPMTDEEKLQLGHLDIGEVVMYRENEHVRMNIVVLPFEEQLVIPI